MTDNGWTGQGGQPSQPVRGWAAGLRFGDRYEVERLIGEGGWAETYRGRDLLLGRVVALKLLRTQFASDPALVDRFEREARIAAAVGHPNVVTVYDYGTQDGTFFIALQFIAGEDLKQHVVRRGRLPAAEAAGVTREILHGLGAIHRAGIVHRDVKPQNVLIGDDGIVRITDFGIAHQSLATRVTTHGDAMGTASYMAPEQAQGEDVTPATDIYALGVVLYELLTGRLPFNRGHAMAILLAHLQETPEPPRQVAPDAQIPGWLEAIVLRAMAKRPEDRFDGAAAMLEALSAADRATSPTATTQRFAGAAAIPGATTLVPAGDLDPTLASGRSRGREARPAAIGGRGAGPPGMSPPVTAARQPSRWGRNLLAAVLVLMVLGIAGVAAASFSGILDGDGDDTDGGIVVDEPTATATIRSIPALATQTPEQEPAERPTEPPRATETETPEPEPTETPIPTREPTPTPPDVPTEVPTEVPADTPTAIPTQSPTPTSVPETPTQTPVPVAEPPPVEEDTETGGSGSADGAGAPILLAAETWNGGAGKKQNDRPPGAGNAAAGGDVASVEARSGPRSTADLGFTLTQIPAAGVRIELQARIERPEDGPALLAISVNDAATAQPIDISGTGDDWAVVDIPVPAEVLVVGQNRIVVTAQEAPGARGRAAVILLGDVTVSQVGGVADDTAVGAPATDSGAGEPPEEVVEQPGLPEADGEAADEGGQPTITPVEVD